MITKKQALDYHSKEPAGKLGTDITKPCNTQRDLSLAYTPGVADPSREIAKDVSKVYDYTNRGNLVAVISNGTAVLGLGDIGPEASKPVMEGKSVLFKRFAGVDSFDLEIDETDPEKMVDIIASLAPSFGGINLEDISSPTCFYVEDELQKRLNIPVFHDDQHGTPIISGAALINALALAGKKIEDVKIVISGAGAAGIRCAEHYIRLGARKKNVYMIDSKGVITKGRKNLTEHKKTYAQNCVERTMDEIIMNADVFVGVSMADILTPEMVMTMASDPIVFALANPDPEIAYALAKRTRDDIIMATGRSDYPNQINNVLGFPFIFRGALDVRAKRITNNMKVAATIALAQLAHESVPQRIRRAYGGKPLRFGADYIVPKPFDDRALVEVSSVVAKAAMRDGVAQKTISISRYRKQLTALARKLQR